MVERVLTLTFQVFREVGLGVYRNMEINYQPIGEMLWFIFKYIFRVQ